MPQTTTDPELDELYAQVTNKYGWVPNLIQEMSVSLPATHVYLRGQEALAKASLTVKERQAVQLAASAFHGCHYCTAVHRSMGRQAHIDDKDLTAILAGQLPADPSLAPLVHTTRLLLDQRGRLSPEELREIDTNGISKRKLYEMIAFIGLKTITNYINHIAHTEVDQQFRECAAEAEPATP